VVNKDFHEPANVHIIQS